MHLTYSAFRYTVFISKCEPTTFALLTQCSTTEPQEHTVSSHCFLYIYIYIYHLSPIFFSLSFLFHTRCTLHCFPLVLSCILIISLYKPVLIFIYVLQLLFSINLTFIFPGNRMYFFFFSLFYCIYVQFFVNFFYRIYFLYINIY